MEIKVEDDVQEAVTQAVDKMVEKLGVKPTQHAWELLCLALQAQIDDEDRPRIWRGRERSGIIRAGHRLMELISADKEFVARAVLHDKIEFNAMLHALVRIGAFIFPSGSND